jgi:hypothetical protein
MNRRNFGLLAGTSLIALKFGHANAQAAKDPSLLKTTLTPFGAERAGNADGSIPAWSGGYTTLPDGWKPGETMPDFFANEQPSLEVNSNNMMQHSDRLSDGVMAMMTKYGFSIEVYPTHRTASAPQFVYDNIAINATTATLSPAGPRFGFLNAYGGIPFPIPDISDPSVAGAQIIWNSNAKWPGYARTGVSYDYVVNNGQRAVLTSSSVQNFNFPYYDKSGNRKSFDGIQFRLQETFNGPANLIGSEDIAWYKTDPHDNPNQAWILLPGQSRVRKAPELQFDTPNSYVDGIANYDDTGSGFSGSLEKYDWKYLGKKEMYVPYNNNGLALLPAEQVHLAHFLDPNAVRWELHRVWVVEATLHPGERNVMSRRKFYVDEDTWQISLADMWDANENLYQIAMVFNIVRPDAPGTLYPSEVVYNLQTGDYCTPGNPWNEKAHPTIRFYDSLPESIFDPEHMAAAAQY